MRVRAMMVGALLMTTGLALWLMASAWDTLIYRSLHVSASAGIVPALVLLSLVGGAAIMIPVGFAAAGWLAVRGERSRALWLVISIAGGRIIVELAKQLLGRNRPPIADRLVAVSSASFPSSHSAGAMLTCVAICVALRAGRSGWSVAAVFVVAVGFTRVALGVHWPSDVVAGWGFGLLWIATLSRALPPSADGRHPHGNGPTISSLDCR